MGCSVMEAEQIVLWMGTPGCRATFPWNLAAGWEATHRRGTTASRVAVATPDEYPRSGLRDEPSQATLRRTARRERLPPCHVEGISPCGPSGHPLGTDTCSGPQRQQTTHTDMVVPERELGAATGRNGRRGGGTGARWLAAIGQEETRAVHEGTHVSKFSCEEEGTVDAPRLCIPVLPVWRPRFFPRPDRWFVLPCKLRPSLSR